MDYTFNAIEAKWCQLWQERKTYQVVEDHTKPKFYVLDMFRIRPVLGCMWGIRWVISRLTFLHATSV